MPQVDKNLLEDLGALIDKMSAAHPDWSRGKVVFNAADLTFPKIVDPLRNTEDDCLHDDSKVERFLSHFTI